MAQWRSHRQNSPFPYCNPKCHKYIRQRKPTNARPYQECICRGDIFCKMHPRGRYILDMDEHWSACVDGCIYDTWDCGKEKVNFAYEITTEPYAPPNISKQVFKYCCTSERISNTETRIRIYDGNGTFVERKIPTELTKGYVLCLQHSNYQYINLDGAKQMKCVL